MSPRLLRTAAFLTLWLSQACLNPPPSAVPTSTNAPAVTNSSSDTATAADAPTETLTPRALEPMTELDAWPAVEAMGRGINIGNTLENTTQWETGWGNPPITQELVQRIAELGFKTVRVPVAWDTYAVDGRILPEKMARVGEVVDWITAAGLFAVVNIHWDGGWIDSSNKEKFAATHATFSPDAERKFVGYWRQIAAFFAHKNEKLLLEALNEETHFENEGSVEKAFATLTRVNQLFVDTVRATGGNNEKRLLIVTGYNTDITKTTTGPYELPADKLPHRLLLSVHYYTPWTFAGLTEDASWGKMALTWGTPAEVEELNRLFDAQREFCTKNDIPAFIGEFSATEKKEHASRVRWLTAVFQAALSRKMIPVLWDTGHGLSRRSPYEPSPAIAEVLKNLSAPAKP